MTLKGGRGLDISLEGKNYKISRAIRLSDQG
jgi:hypothetical protein